MGEKESVDLCIVAKWVVPVVPSGVVHEDSTVVVKGGDIVAIVPHSTAEEKYDAKEVVRLDKRHALVPGLVNMHAHSAMTLLRAIQDDVSLMDWLQNYIWPAESACVTEEYVEDGALLACAEMLRTGTTAFNDQYFFPEATARAAAKTGMRALVGAPIINVETAWSKSGQEGIAKGMKLHEQYKDHDTVHISLAPHAPYTVSDELFTEVMKLADEHDLRVHLHLHETEFEVTSVEERPVARMERLGVLTERLIAVHMVHLTDEEISLIASKGIAAVVHCPSSNLKLSSGVARLRELSKAGVRLCIGTDGAASNDSLDMWQEIRLAALLERSALSPSDGRTVLCSQLLEAATINGARALGIAHRTGSLEEGKAADLAAVRIRSEPVYDLFTNLVFCGTNTVTHVWTSGIARVVDEKLVCVDEEELLDKARVWGE
eukprot:CAMPEP_0114626150 /NCGR_PEP_ID=MMETSP0168-20121206/11631_1 /TAXON_ID=95228 ORGANISM="Vannella sp., Strain DIVA3 517/6/12" /NCGR_SAMPLE_ID=MMETSP0168 /ASSEMBLY_ACC=CAM_ASM_000044 /LENGTH=432 /DNA_ID=CAMNT_0001837441 /DNA_START=12 /DNA_END=1307 /DNA_ORIENTATION=+